MRTSVIRNTREAVDSTLNAVKEYAVKHDLTFAKDDYKILDSEGNEVLFFFYHGHDFLGIVHPEDFEAPDVLDTIGSLDVKITDMKSAVRILRARSDVDLRNEKSGMYFYHQGAIMVCTHDSEIVMKWYGRGSYVTQHAAAILGLLKECVG